MTSKRDTLWIDRHCLPWEMTRLSVRKAGGRTMMTALWGPCGLLGYCYSHQDNQRRGALVEYARVTELMVACDDIKRILTAIECLACTLRDRIPRSAIFKVVGDAWWKPGGLDGHFANVPIDDTIPAVVLSEARRELRPGGIAGIRPVKLLQALTVRGQQAIANVVCEGLEREQWWRRGKTTGRYYPHALAKHIDLVTIDDLKRRLYALAGRPRARTYQRVDHRKTRFAGR